MPEIQGMLFKIRFCCRDESAGGADVVEAVHFAMLRRLGKSGGAGLTKMLLIECPMPTQTIRQCGLDQTYVRCAVDRPILGEGGLVVRKPIGGVGAWCREVCGQYDGKANMASRVWDLYALTDLRR